MLTTSENFAVLLSDMARAARNSTSPAACLSPEWREAQEALLTASPFPNGARQGVLIPWREGRAMTATGTTSTAGDQGGMTIAQVPQDAGLALRDALVLPSLGANMVANLRENVSFPREQPGIAAQWLTENAASTVSNFNFATLGVQPYRVTAFLDVSAQLLVQNPANGEFLRAALFAALAEACQQAAINGTGTNQPRGILSTSGITSITDAGGNGSAPTAADLYNLEYQAANAKAETKRLGWLVSPKVRKSLRSVPSFTGSSLPVWPTDSSGSLLGHPAGVTTASPDTLTAGTSAGNCSAIIAGGFAEMFLCFWGPGILLDAIPIITGTNGMQGLTRFIATVFFDSGVRTPAAFAVKPDALC